MTDFRTYMRELRRFDGWFSPQAAALWDSLLAFQVRRGIRGHLFEVGVWCGRSAVLLALHKRSSEELVLLDKVIQRRNIEKALLRVGRRIDDCRLVEADSFQMQAEEMLLGLEGGFRWSHIDGMHTDRAVTNDLALADRMLADDGVVCVDDFFSEEYPQITQAVLRATLDSPERWSLFLCGFNKGYLVRPRFAHDYLEFVRDELAGTMADRRCPVTLFKTTDPEDMNCFGIRSREKRAPELQGPDWDRDSVRI